MNSINKEQKKRLLQLLVDKSFRYSEEKTFKLSSGEYSNYYIDSKCTTLDPEGMDLIGNIVFSLIQPLSVTALGGLTLGADPIAFSASMISLQKGQPISPFVVRKSSKQHGTKKSIEGNVKENDRVVIIDDVITTGKSTLEAIKKAREANLSVVKVIVLVDREEGGKEAIVKEGVEVVSIVTRTELIEAVKKN